jgi:beta-lactamase regulating signal transducer with metallopeptidase domain
VLLQSLPLDVVTQVAICSAKGTVLILAVVLLRRVLVPATASQWRHVVWLPALVCLICPLGVRLPVTASIGSSLPATVAAPTAAPRAATQMNTEPARAASTRPKSLLGMSREAAFGSSLAWLELMWAAGAVALAFLYVRNLLRFRRIRRAAHAVEGSAAAIFEACKAELRLRRTVRLLQSREIESPTVFGCRHPTLLLPLGLGERLGATRLRHVLLHELAHVKRNDVLVNWFAALAQLLHWFNPAVWLAMRLLRADMEFACDASVLRRLSAVERGEYGETLVHMADAHGSSSPAPYALGIVDRNADLKGRLIMIARFRTTSLPIKLASTVALLVFACVALIQPGFTSPSGDRSGTAQGVQTAAPTAAAGSPAAEGAHAGGVPLRVLIEQVAANIHKRVIADPSAASTVILYGQGLNQITYGDFLTILRINGFTAIDVNNYINVVPIADVRMMPLPTMTSHGELPDDQFANMSIELKNACAPALVPTLRPWMPRYAYLNADMRSNTILAIDTYANLKRVRSIISELDARTKPGLRCGPPTK